MNGKDPKRNQVKKILGPGVWVDANDALHFNVPELLNLFGLEDTPENHRIAVENIKQMIEEQSPGTPVRYRKSPEE